MKRQPDSCPAGSWGTTSAGGGQAHKDLRPGTIPERCCWVISVGLKFTCGTGPCWQYVISHVGDWRDGPNPCTFVT